MSLPQPFQLFATPKTIIILAITEERFEILKVNIIKLNTIVYIYLTEF